MNPQTYGLKRRSGPLRAHRMKLMGSAAGVGLLACIWFGTSAYSQFGPPPALTPGPEQTLALAGDTIPWQPTGVGANAPPNELTPSEHEALAQPLLSVPDAPYVGEEPNERARRAATIALDQTLSDQFHSNARLAQALNVPMAGLPGATRRAGVFDGSPATGGGGASGGHSGAGAGAPAAAKEATDSEGGDSRARLRGGLLASETGGSGTTGDSPSEGDSKGDGSGGSGSGGSGSGGSGAGGSGGGTGDSGGSGSGAAGGSAAGAGGGDTGGDGGEAGAQGPKDEVHSTVPTPDSLTVQEGGATAESEGEPKREAFDATIPEPGLLLLTTLGLGAIVARRRRTQRG